MSIAPRKEYERVKVDEFINGVIVEVQEDMEHTFSFQGKERIDAGVRFVFELDGYKERHYSRWMKFSYDERATLYDKYIKPLVAGAKQYMKWDIQNLKGMKVKVSWGQKEYNGKIFQSVETIIPADKKIIAVINEDEDIVDSEDSPSEEIPF